MPEHLNIPNEAMQSLPENWYTYVTNVICLDVSAVAEVSRERDSYALEFKRISAWLEENNLEARVYSRNDGRVRIDTGMGIITGHLRSYPLYLAISPEGNTHPNFAGFPPLEPIKRTCDSCGHESDPFSLLCQGCDAIFYCSNCARESTSAFVEYMTNTIRTHTIYSYCIGCGYRCSGCGNRYHSGFLNECCECLPRFNCTNCGDCYEGEGVSLDNRDGEAFCETCSLYYCGDCGAYQDHEILPNENGERVCRRCMFKGIDGTESFDENAKLSAIALVLPGMEGREFIRDCGVEIEGAGGEDAGHTIARKLYNAELNVFDHMAGWHRGEGFAKVETDSSVDWECIIGPIKMTDINSVRKLNKAVRIIKESIKDGEAKFDLRCGTHIHVGAERVSLSQAYNLHVLYTYLEDVLYRLGAAHWKIHRSLLHDEGHEYCMISEKQNSRSKFARTFAGDGARYYGLNFHNYFEAMLGQCRCGAGKYGAYEECTCELGKCTFEFRFFNATANTIKLHAYLALCQALVAKSISMDDIKNPDDFRELNFIAKPIKNIFNENPDLDLISKWEERLRFISQLPLTINEKNSILYCIEHSELKKVNPEVKRFFCEDESPKSNIQYFYPVS